jgi:uncharacterized protein (DUF4415 family)
MSTLRTKQSALPALTAERQAELEMLARLPDETIDYGDIPPLSEELWRRAVRNPLYRPTKTHATVRIDSDVMAWLKSQGKDYQTRLNSILRQAMLEAFKKAHG